MTESTDHNPPAERSTFVTALAWSFIVLAALSVLYGLIQFLLVQLFVDQEALRAGMRTEHSIDELPATIRFTFSNLQLLAGAFLGLSALLLAASIGLLKRRNWARWVFVAFMVIGVVGHLAPLAGGTGLIEWSVGLLAGSPGELPGSVQGLIRAAWIVFAFLSVLLAAVFGWIGWRLTRPDVSAEFKR